MAKQMAKYFIAIVPEGEIQEKATELKYNVKELFHSKYALKSPAHVTLKMPFNWNEAKEDKLIEKFTEFFMSKTDFDLVFKGIGRFGRRVIYIRVQKNDQLMLLQDQLSTFCKADLKLVKEFSDSSFTPHMTICFKDLKDRYFDDCLIYLKEKGFNEAMLVSKIAILKKIELKWKVIHQFGLVNRLT